MPVSIKYQNLHCFKEELILLYQSILETKSVTHLHGSAHFTIPLRYHFHIYRSASIITQFSCLFYLVFNSVPLRHNFNIYRSASIITWFSCLFYLVFNSVPSWKNNKYFTLWSYPNCRTTFTTPTIHSRFVSSVWKGERQSHNRGKQDFHHCSQDFQEESMTEAKGSILYF